jgi:hypothetical protein
MRRIRILMTPSGRDAVRLLAVELPTEKPAGVCEIVVSKRDLVARLSKMADRWLREDDVIVGNLRRDSILGLEWRQTMICYESVVIWRPDPRVCWRAFWIARIEIEPALAEEENSHAPNLVRANR